MTDETSIEAANTSTMLYSPADRLTLPRAGREEFGYKYLGE
jgi:hypothetical protein